MAQRTWTPWELTMIGEWVAACFPDAEYRTNVRLGRDQSRLPDGTYTKDEQAMLSRWRRYVDAIVILHDRLLLVEATMRAHPGKLSMLAIYAMLVPQTEELKDYWHLPVQKVLLYSIEDPALNELARREGVLPILFVPSFFDEWLETLRPRDKRAPATPS